jgi:UDP-N-acetylglucosamine--N-acetylmuramyl-(pentapeptide) pyrophosphoryl-undecaprenol N-acetylglucosamine transferase
MGDTRTIILAGGGTGGHLYPGIAVAEALQSIDSTIKPLFLCTEREIDRVILEPTGFEYIPQSIVPPVKTVGGLLKFWKSWRETKDLVRRILKDRQPIAVLGLGGYAAGVAVKVAGLRGIPTAVLNPDVIPGKANQYLMRYVQAVFCQFEATNQKVSSEYRPKLRVTGCPIRQDMRSLPDREAAAARLGIDRRLQTLVITGASLGAQTVNEAVLESLKDMELQGWQVVHLSGREHADAVRAAYREISVAARVIDFTPAMADVWAIADLSICRAGASTCAELTACGVPSILMPYPYHKDMHQRANARVLADANAAVLLDDTKDRKQNAAKLRPILESLMRDHSKRQAMREQAKKIALPDAAENIAREIMRMGNEDR